MSTAPLEHGRKMDQAVCRVVYDIFDDIQGPPPYSTNPVTAFIAAARMVEKGYDFGITQCPESPDLTCRWTAQFSRDRRYFAGFGPTAPDAICRAIIAIGRNTLTSTPPPTIEFKPVEQHHGDFYSHTKRSSPDLVIYCRWGDDGQPSVGMKYHIDRGWLPACEVCRLASESAATVPTHHPHTDDCPACREMVEHRKVCDTTPDLCTHQAPDPYSENLAPSAEGPVSPQESPDPVQ